MKTKIALLLCISTLVVTVSGCGNQADMAEVDTANTADTEIQSNNVLTEDDIEASWNRFRDRALNNYGMTEEDARAMYQKIEDSEILAGENIELTGMALGDYDQNGQTDMIVCLYEEKENGDAYRDGCLYLFMNSEKPYYIYDDFCCYYFGNIFGDFGADIDHDGNTEIVFCVRGTGVGGAGDCEKFVIKYKDKEIERMELPSDFPEKYDFDSGLQIEVKKDEEKGVYNVYCPYFDETVVLNTEDEAYGGSGANSRGYYMLEMTWYQEEKFLTGYEYIYAGNILQGLGSAVFLFDWDENGTAYVRDWYVDDGKMIYLPSIKLPESLFDENETSEEVKAYEEFLTGKLAAHIDNDIYADTSCRGITASHPEGMDKDGEGFYIEELINEIINEIVRPGVNGIGSVQYAFIDCGNDGKKQLALRAYGLSIYSRNDDSDCTMVFDYKGGKVSMIYAADSWARSSTELYANGYAHGCGSDGATSNYEWEGIIGADGVYHKSFEYNIVYGGSDWNFLDINDKRRYRLRSKTYSINEEKIYSYDIDDADITEEVRQGALDCIQERESLLGVDILPDDEAWELVEKNRKRLGITDDMDAEENTIDWRPLSERRNPL